MTVPIQNLRSGTASKRPVATGLAVGQIAVNYNETDPAIYLRGDADALVKVSPTFVGSTAPNATPASGGSSGNSKGETWLDTSTTPAGLKIWDGSAWVNSYALASGTTIVSPTLSGVPTAPTAAVGTDTTQVATTAFVNAEIANDAPTKTGGGASGTWDISISGNASTATALQTARTISLGGDLSGSASFNGGADITITAAVADDSHAHIIGNVDGLQTALDAKAPLASPSLTGTVTIANLDITGRIKEDATSTTTSINCSTGNYFYITINSNSTFTFGSVPSGAYGFVLEVTHTSGTITWPSSVKWPADTAPTLTTGKTHLFVFVTDDSGTRWRGASLVDYVN